MTLLDAVKTYLSAPNLPDADINTLCQVDRDLFAACAPITWTPESTREVRAWIADLTKDGFPPMEQTVERVQLNALDLTDILNLSVNLPRRAAIWAARERSREIMQWAIRLRALCPTLDWREDLATSGIQDLAARHIGMTFREELAPMRPLFDQELIDSLDGYFRRGDEPWAHLGPVMNDNDGQFEIRFER